MTATTIRPAQSISLSEAFLRKTGLYTSEEKADEDASSCESAVLIEAAKIAERRIPAINSRSPFPLKIMRTIVINTRLFSFSASADPMNSWPTRPTTVAIPRMIVVQTEPIMRDFFISASDLIDM